MSERSPRERGHGVNPYADPAPVEAAGVRTDHPDSFETRARQVLPDYVSAYYGATAGRLDGSAEGEAAWSALRFRPRALRDVSVIDTTTTVLGTPVASPVLVAPMAQQHAADPEAEVAVARAVAAAGGLLGVTTHVSVPYAAIGATGAPWWFQVYVMRDRGLTALLVQRARDHGARALLLTVDMLALLPAPVNPRSWPVGPARARHGNLTPEELVAAGPSGLEMDPSIDFGTIGWLREVSGGLPVLVKGVLRADDARRAVDAGAAGVVVSTHGGRRLGPSVTSARALPEVVAAVGDDAEVYVDSGLRSGEHVAGALALGARAVFVGRPVMWALAAAGERGVVSVLGDLDTGLRRVMTQLGTARLADLTEEVVAR
ncbi:MAG: 4-hydroxymandelate oxidase [Friedmanniella sp.]|nr:4-hydroxymandelate oxidase [Friedmanniella sp.]